MLGAYSKTSRIETNYPILVKSANKYMKNKTKDEIITQIHDNETFEIDYDWGDIEPCPTCGELNGRINPCCKGYDPLHIDNCGYGQIFNKVKRQNKHTLFIEKYLVYYTKF